jgi:hypothetical protein
LAKSGCTFDTIVFNAGPAGKNIAFVMNIHNVMYIVMYLPYVWRPSTHSHLDTIEISGGMETSVIHGKMEMYTYRLLLPGAIYSRIILNVNIGSVFRGFSFRHILNSQFAMSSVCGVVWMQEP